MNARNLSVVLAASLFGFSCGGCGAPTFETTVKGTASVPGAPGLLKLINDFGPLNGFTDMNLDQSQDFQNQGVKKSQVESVKVTAFTLQITSPATQDFSFLKGVQFFASAQGVPEALIAEKSGIDTLGLKAPNPTLTLDVKDVELQPFVTAPTMTIRASVTGHQPDQDTTLEAKVTLKVVPKVF